MLVILCSVPALFAAGGLYWKNYSLERQALVQQSVSSARNIALLVDAKFGAIEAVLHSLAVLPSLRDGDLDKFRVESAYLSPPEWLNGIVLTELGGRIAYDSSRTPQARGSIDQGQYLNGSSAPGVSKPFMGGFPIEPVIGVTVPVEVRGQHVYNLTGLVRTQEFTKLHLTAEAPDSWLFSIVDQNGHIVSRTTNLPAYFGHLANPSLLRAMRGGDEGAFDGATVEDRPVLGVFSRAPGSRWTVAIGIPAEELSARLRLTVLVSGAAVFFALVIAMLAVWAVARNIARSVHGLRAPALALGRGESPQLPGFYFREAEEVGHELLKAADLLQNARHRANHDPLTGLPNRELFGHLAEQQIAVAQRTNATFSILFIDLDGFKNVNDTLGHQAGDELLIQVARRMRVHTRAADTISRQGGDEFAVLLFGTGEEEGIRVAQGLLEAISFPYRLDDNTCTVSASIGVATYPADGRSVEALLRSADHAMYTAKARGKNRVVAAHDAVAAK